MPFLRHARDKRGYETTFVMHSFRPGAGQATGRTRLLYMFRTPSNRKVGRNLLDPEVMEALEHTHPDLTFDWTALMRTPALTAPDPDRSDRDRERDRDRGRQRRDERRERQQDERRERQDNKPAARREAAPAAAPPPQIILEDESTLGRTLGAVEAARLRAAYTEVTQRIVRRSRTPEERDRLSERVARLNPDDWADEPSIKDGAAQFAVELEAIRQELPRRRRGRRGGRARDREGAPTGTPGDANSAILEGHEHEMDTSAGGDDPGHGHDLGTGDAASDTDAGEQPDGREVHERD